MEISFIKSLNQAKKDYPQLNDVIKLYECGLITFDECLHLLYSGYHDASRNAAIEYWKGEKPCIKSF